MPAKKVQGLFSFKEMVVELVLHILYRDESGIGGTSRTERWRGVSDVINDHTGRSLLELSGENYEDFGGEYDRYVIHFKDTHRRHPAILERSDRPCERNFKFSPEQGERVEAREVVLPGQYI